ARRHRAAVTIAAIALAGFAVGSTVAVSRVVSARDHAQHESQIATIRKTAAERLTDYMVTDMQSRLRAIGRLDLMAGLGTEIRRYYATLMKIPGGMPSEDVIRMAEAIDMVGEAEHTSGRGDLALASFL